MSALTIQLPDDVTRHFSDYAKTGRFASREQAIREVVAGWLAADQAGDVIADAR